MSYLGEVVVSVILQMRSRMRTHSAVEFFRGLFNGAFAVIDFYFASDQWCCHQHCQYGTNEVTCPTSHMSFSLHCMGVFDVKGLCAALGYP